MNPGTDTRSQFHMNFSLILTAWSTLGAAQALADSLPEPDLLEQQKVLAEAAASIVNHDADSPTFVCLQTTHRFENVNGRGWNPIETIVEQVAYLNDRGVYQVRTGNGQTVRVPANEARGASASTEVGSDIETLFTPQTPAIFRWHNWTVLRGTRMYVYTYEVPAALGLYHIEFSDRSMDLMTPYHGLVFVDAQRHCVHRITLHADEIPPEFPVQDIAVSVDYDYRRISDAEYLLPLQFELRSRQGNRLIKNDVSYGDYRKFSAASASVFDQLEPTQ